MTNNIHTSSEKLSNKFSNVGCKVNDFEFLNELGRGSYGIVYKVKSKIDNNIYVIKKLNLTHMNEKSQQESWKEALILKKLNHKHIITYHTSFLEENNLYIVMEYAQGGDLYSYLKEYKLKNRTFLEDELWKFCIEILVGLDYLHQNNIIHRDIKCLNIFLTKDKLIKIGDLGVSKIVSNLDALICSRVGTPLYLSPELIKQKPYDFKVDLWAVGCSLYHLAALEPPFSGDNLIVLGNNIVKTKHKPLSSTLSNEFTGLVDRLLSKNPEHRPTPKQALEIVPKIYRDEYYKRIKNYSKKEKEADAEIDLINEKIDNFESKLSTIEKKNEKDLKPIKDPQDKLFKIDDREKDKAAKNEQGILVEQNIHKLTENEEVKNKIELKNNYLILNNNLSKEQLPDLIQKNVINIPKEKSNNIINFRDNNLKNGPKLEKMKTLDFYKELQKPQHKFDDNYRKSMHIFGDVKSPNKFSQIPEITSGHQRILSSKTRVGKQSSRPFTASNNRNLPDNKTKINNKFNKIENNLIPNSIFSDRPLTGVNKYRKENNIINININFFNIDLNQRYFDKKSEKKLLHFNHNLTKKENSDSNKDINILKKINLQENLKQIFSNKNSIESARVGRCNPFISNNFSTQDKVTESKGILGDLKNKNIEKNDVLKEKSKKEKKPIVNNQKNERKSPNNFIFHKILSSFDENKKLTIKDFK